MILRARTEDDSLVLMAEEVRAGLAEPLPALPCKYFYDDRGSELFDAITRLPEYYQTRTEERILERIASDVIARTRPRRLVELGSGLGRKIRLLLDAARAAGSLQSLTLFDVNDRCLEESGARLVAEFFAGTIGNLHPSEAPAFLGRLAARLAPGAAFLVGLDLVKEEARLHAAYNDVAGVTAEFNRNILRVVNRKLGGDFDPAAFDHVAFYDRKRAWIEMCLRARRRLDVRIERAGLRLHYESGDEIRTEISCKFTRESFEALLPGTGLTPEQWYTDDEQLFALALLRADPLTGSDGSGILPT